MIRLKRIRAGRYEYGKWLILKDVPQLDCAVGNYNNVPMWNLYDNSQGNDGDVVLQRRLLLDIRLELEHLTKEQG